MSTQFARRPEATCGILDLRVFRRLCRAKALHTRCVAADKMLSTSLGRPAVPPKGHLLRRLRILLPLLLTPIMAAGFMVGCAPVPPKPVLLVYGDSLTVLSEPAANLLLSPKYTLVFRAAGGTALCDWVPGSAVDRRRYRPSRVVIALTGNNLTDCIRSDYEKGGEAALVSNYQSALIAMHSTFAGIPISVLAIPAAEPQPARHGARPNGSPALNAMYRSICLAYGMHYDTRADDTLTPGHRFVWQRPAFPGSGPVVTVRRSDGLHVTPAGSLYYAAAFAG
jgi:hypothetical protein